MTDPRFQLSPGTAAVLAAAVVMLSADLDHLRAQLDRQPPEWRASPVGVEVASWLDLMENLFAAMDDVEHAPPQTQKEPPVTGVVTGGSGSRGS